MTPQGGAGSARMRFRTHVMPSKRKYSLLIIIIFSAAVFVLHSCFHSLTPCRNEGEERKKAITTKSNETQELEDVCVCVCECL